MNIKKSIQLVCVMLCVLMFASCEKDASSSSSSNSKQEFTGQLFKKLSPDDTNVNFLSVINETAKFNHLYWSHLYTGYGVSLADFNGDGLQDIYFTGNLIPDKLYYNKGNMEFEDVTLSAGILAEDGWSEGVTAGDVNQDGHLDIYVCRTGYTTNPAVRQNLLYVNNGDGTFKEQAAAYGLADRGYSMQATFFDKDNDGDLDLLVGNQPPDARQKNNPIFKSQLGYEFTSDHLYENQGNNKFVDVTKAAGLETYSYTLNTVASDINDDGWVDLYLSCDYDKPDYLFLNNKNGTFTNQGNEKLGHISNFSMGADIADYNNDGHKDIMTVDMAAADHYRSKTNMASMRPARFWSFVENGWHYQYMSNVLQKNNGNGSYSEVSQLAGMSKTDWSWACLFADLDNDGYKDISITNGIQRDIRNNDFIGHIKSMNKKGVTEFNPKELIDKIPSNPIPNHFYKNNKNLTFTEKTVNWGLGEPGFSNGMAYADLDNDGDLDLVVCNVGKPADIFENQLNGSRNYLRVRLKGEGSNKLAMNAKVVIEHGNEIQTQELTLTRGFYSSVENALHFGLGKAQIIDKLTVTWPNGKETIMTDVKPNQVLEISQKTASGIANRKTSTNSKYFVASNRVDFTHKENSFDDFSREILLPHKQSIQGPNLASGDVNGDGLEDVYIGGAAGQSGVLMLQSVDGSFTKAPSQPWSADAGQEDGGSLLFDADNDGDLDLYIVSGGTEHENGSPKLRDRLYLNNGNSNFAKSSKSLPVMHQNGQVVKASDIDADGDLDLFVGGRGQAGHYPSPSKSFLLENDGEGNFKDITKEKAPSLSLIGMVSDAIFTDYDGDKDLDLIAVGEWMPITIFTNNGGTFVKDENPVLEKTGGWWWSIAEGDFNKDGLPDYIIGNMGKNHKYKASPDHPFTIFGNDFDNNGTNDVVLASYSGDKLLPVRGRECTSEQMPFVAEKFPTYDGFAKATIETIYEDKLKESVTFEVHDFHSIILENGGNGKLSLKNLPNDAQTSPMRAIKVLDLNKDGHLDFVSCGNLFQAEVETMRHDAGVGLVMLGDGKGNFKNINSSESGFFANKDARDIAILKGKKDILIVANNDDKVESFNLK